MAPLGCCARPRRPEPRRPAHPARGTPAGPTPAAAAATVAAARRSDRPKRGAPTWASACIASGRPPTGAGITYGTPARGFRSNSTRTVLRSLRTTCAIGSPSEIRTRAIGTPIDSTRSTTTSVMTPGRFAARALVTPSAPTLRKSSRTVSGSGRVVRYGTGSLASMTSDGPVRPARSLMLLSLALGAAGVSAAVPGRPPATPATAAVRTRARPLVTVTASRPPRSQRFANLPLLDERQWIVDFLHDDESFGRHRLAPCHRRAGRPGASCRSWLSGPCTIAIKHSAALQDAAHGNLGSGHARDAVSAPRRRSAAIGADAEQAEKRIAPPVGAVQVRVRWSRLRRLRRDGRRRAEPAPSDPPAPRAPGPPRRRLQQHQNERIALMVMSPASRQRPQESRPVWARPASRAARTSSRCTAR